MTSGGRDQVALQPPAKDLADYPRREVHRGQRWYREHGEKGPWWFAAGPGGRFNLDAPRGTLYLANGPECAARERIGMDQARVGWISAGLVRQRFVSELELQHDVSAARLTHGNALNWGVVSNELTAVDEYDLTRSWARAFDAAGFDGLWGRLRFSAGHGRGLSIFGDQGARAWPTDPHAKTLRQFIEKEMRLTVVDPPHSSALTIADP